MSRTAHADGALREALLTTRVLSVMEAHGRALTGAALSLDGQLRALASRDDSGSVWRVKTGERLALCAALATTSRTPRAAPTAGSS